LRIVLTSLRVSAERYYKLFQRYYKLFKEGRDLAKDFADTADLGADIYAGKPVVLDEELISRINKQADLYGELGRQLTPPRLEDPFAGESRAQLGSIDPRVRGAALQRIESKFKQYERQIARWQEKTDVAGGIHRQATASYQRLVDLETKLVEINSSPVGGMLNAATGNKYAFLWADTTTVLSDAVTKRASNAGFLQASYEKSLLYMKAQLAAYGEVRDWMGFYHWQDAQRVRTGDSAVDRLFRDARAREQRARENMRQGGEISPDSPETRRIEEIIRESEIQSERVQRQVRDKLRRAAVADEAAAAQQELQALLGLAAAGAGAAQSSAPPSGPTFNFNYRSIRIYAPPSYTPPAAPSGTPSGPGVRVPGKS
jgi:hypothetical protein